MRREIFGLSNLEAEVTHVESFQAELLQSFTAVARAREMGHLVWVADEIYRGNVLGVDVAPNADDS